MLTPKRNSVISSRSPWLRHSWPRPARQNQYSSTDRCRTGRAVCPGASRAWQVLPAREPARRRISEPSGATQSGPSGSRTVSKRGLGTLSGISITTTSSRCRHLELLHIGQAQGDPPDRGQLASDCRSGQRLDRRAVRHRRRCRRAHLLQRPLARGARQDRAGRRRDDVRFGFLRPQGVSVAANGDIYIADSNGSAVHRYR